MSWREGISNSWIGRILRGIIKLVLIPLIISLLNAVNINLSNVNIGGSTYDLSVLVTVIKIFAPLLLLLSALRDFGVEL